MGGGVTPGNVWMFCMLRTVKTRRSISGHVVESRSGFKLISFGFGFVRMRCAATRRRKC